MVFQINDYINPNTVGIHYGIDFYIMDSTIGYMLQKLNNSIQINVPNRPKFVSITSLTKEVNKITDFNFTIFPLSFLVINSRLNIKFPDEFGVKG